MPVWAADQALPELLLPVDQASISSFYQRFNASYKEKLYFANPGRHRIVMINFDLLDKDNAMFTITPFPEAKNLRQNGQVTLQAKEAKKLASTDSYGEMKLWKGQVLKPAATFGTANGRPVSAKELERVNAISLTVSRSTMRVPRELLMELRVRADKSFPMIPNEPSGRSLPSESPVMMMRVRTVLGNWFSPASQSFVHILPIADDPRYHLVYEEDMNKRLGQGGKDAEARMQAFRDFSKTLEQEYIRFEGDRTQFVP
jgi:hypothetical protein